VATLVVAKLVVIVTSLLFLLQSPTRSDNLLVMASFRESQPPMSEEVAAYVSMFGSMKRVNNLRRECKVSSTGQKEDVIIDLCAIRERVYMWYPQGVSQEGFYMYSCVLADSGVRILFTGFKCEVLKTINMTPSQIHPNSWAYIRVYEILC
jgi:hypothetical protein